MTSDISDTVYASRRKELLALINQLRAVGAQNDLDLPRITVIGNQSAGKSSVVEAISGITVPRDAGTCTRCPMECRLLSSPGPWTCRISIRKEVDEKGKRLGEVSEKPFGSAITDKSKVELALRRAQFAVLNPEIRFSHILNASAQELKDATSEKSLPFSQNVVCVDLEGPELTDLSFVDLPGLIQNADPDVVKLVEDMVISHIQGNCIILVAIPMTDDIENQKALRLARQEDETGRRTIGVLTKPDMLGTGSTKTASLWLDVIQGVRHPLMHGYYCTRQPDDDERSAGIGPQKAREAEETFFKTTLPWSRSSHPGRFGTKNLVVTLSRLLVQIIDDNLPKIREDTAKQLSDCRKELEGLPPQILEEPATYMLSLVTTFCSEFQTLVHGRADAAELIRTHRQSYATFKTAIRKTAPNFVPFVDTEKATNFNNCLDDEKDDPIANVPAAGALSMDLSQIRRHIEQSLTRELPNNVPYDAKASLIVQFQKTWSRAVETCFESVETTTLAILFKMVDSHFARFTLLQSHIKNFTKSLIETHKQKCDAILAATIEAELMPYTQNDHYLQSTTQGWLDKYKAVRSENTEPTRSAFDAGAFTFEHAAPSTSKDTTGAKFTFDKSVFGVSAGFASKNTTMEGGFPPNSNPFGPFFATSPSSPQPNTSPSSSPPSNAPSASAWSSPQPATATNTQKPIFPTTAASSSPSVTHDPKIDEKAFQDAIALLIQAGIPAGSLTSTELLGKLLPPDEYEKELRVMAEVRGYFQVAYKRMIDNIPRFIDLLFVRELGKTLQPVLISKFGMGTPSANERCASYLGEDPALVLRREELSAKKKRLESVEKELDEFSLHI